MAKQNSQIPVIKTAEVVQLTHTRDWLSPHTNSLLYYYDIILSDMTVGTIGTTVKDDPKFAVGTTIHYQKNGNKITYEKNPDIARSMAANKGTKPTTSTPKKAPVNYVPRSNTKNQADFLGQAWSYAKDLVLAGKTIEDVKNMTEIANAIYKEIGITLNYD